MLEISSAKVASTALALFSKLSSYSNRQNFERVISSLEADEVSLDEACKADPYYLACLVRTIDAIKRATSVEKLELLKRFFIGCENNNLLKNDPDRYGEALSIISEMSMRELQLLALLSEAGLLHKDDERVTEPSSSQTHHLESPADVFLKARKLCSERLNITESMVDSLLVRLQRTGLILNAPTWESTYYFFSPLYTELKCLITYGYYE